jgi:hypothetical protein
MLATKFGETVALLTPFWRGQLIPPSKGESKMRNRVSIQARAARQSPPSFQFSNAQKIAWRIVALLAVTNLLTWCCVLPITPFAVTLIHLLSV